MECEYGVEIRNPDNEVVESFAIINTQGEDGCECPGDMSITANFVEQCNGDTELQVVMGESEYVHTMNTAIDTQLTYNIRVIKGEEFASHNSEEYFASYTELQPGGTHDEGPYETGTSKHIHFTGDSHGDEATIIIDTVSVTLRIEAANDINYFVWDWQGTSQHVFSTEDPNQSGIGDELYMNIPDPETLEEKYYHITYDKSGSAYITIGVPDPNHLTMCISTESSPYGPYIDSVTYTYKGFAYGRMYYVMDDALATFPNLIGECGKADAWFLTGTCCHSGASGVSPCHYSNYTIAPWRRLRTSTATRWFYTQGISGPQPDPHYPYRVISKFSSHQSSELVPSGASGLYESGSRRWPSQPEYRIVSSVTDCTSLPPTPTPTPTPTGVLHTQHKLYASDRWSGTGTDYSVGHNSQFGSDASISGDYAIVGSPGHDGVETDEGAAYIFERMPDGTWPVTETQKIQNPSPQENAGFGRQVAIDGNYVFVATGARAFGHIGTVHIFERTAGGTWDHIQQIQASDASTGDGFGMGISVSGDYLIAGVVTWPNGPGRAYIFERNGSGTWVEVQKILASDGNVTDSFGEAVDISGDYAIVGAHSQDWATYTPPHPTNPHEGAAYIFERNGSGTWVEVQKLKGFPDPQVDASQFGLSVAIGGNYVVVGAPNTVVGSTISEATFIFERDGSGNWNEMQKIQSHDHHLGDSFGYGAAIDGDYIVVNAGNWSYGFGQPFPHHDYGSAYLFERLSGSLGYHWEEVQKLVPWDHHPVDLFGGLGRPGISGNSVIVGAPLEDQPADGVTWNPMYGNDYNPGSAYIFDG